jgi:hypothetical protein
VPALLGCRTPEVRTPEAYTVRLYDLGDAGRLVCDLKPTGTDGAQGTVQARAPGGESFQGEWTRLACRKAAASAGADGKYPSTLPVLPPQASPLEAAWGWAADLGIDFDHLPASYGSFFLYGSGGTRIVGFFLDPSAAGEASVGAQVRQFFQRDAAPRQAHLVGAARDNLGHRYKLIGNSTEGTMKITSTPAAARSVAASPTGKGGAAGRSGKDKGTPAFQDHLAPGTPAPAQDPAPAGKGEAAGKDAAASQGQAAGKDAAATQGQAKVSAEAAAEAKAAEGGTSSAKAFAYGALGVDAPEGESSEQKDDYQAGQWAGAAVKVGGIIALLA